MNVKRKPIFVPKMTECPFDNPYGYIYIYTNKENGHRYIGKHKFDKPYIDLSYRGSGSVHWNRALKKYGWDGFDKEVLCWVRYDNSYTDYELNELLNEWEIYFIDLLGTFENTEDYNETHGGDGMTSDLMSGENNPMYGTHINAGKNNYFYGKRFFGKDNPNYGGKSVTEHQRQVMREKMLGKEPVNKGVPMTDERLKQHTEAMNKLSKDPEWLDKLRKGVKKRSENQQWLDKQRKNAIAKRMPVYQYSINGEFIMRHEFPGAAAEFIGQPKSNAGNISKCCNGKIKSAYGYVWKYEKDVNIKEAQD